MLLGFGGGFYNWGETPRELELIHRCEEELGSTCDAKKV